MNLTENTPFSATSTLLRFCLTQDRIQGISRVQSATISNSYRSILGTTGTRKNHRPLWKEMTNMFEIVSNEINECGATGIWKALLFLRFYIIVCRVTVRCHIQGLYHWFKGDYDAWLDNLEAEDNKRG